MARSRLPRGIRQISPDYPVEYEEQESKILREIAARRKLYMDRYKEAELRYGSATPIISTQPSSLDDRVLPQQRKDILTDNQIVQDLFR